jgi:hypothetical protein
MSKRLTLEDKEQRRQLTVDYVDLEDSGVCVDSIIERSNLSDCGIIKMAGNINKIIRDLINSCTTDGIKFTLTRPIGFDSVDFPKCADCIGGIKINCFDNSYLEHQVFISIWSNKSIVGMIKDFVDKHYPLKEYKYLNYKTSLPSFRCLVVQEDPELNKFTGDVEIEYILFKDKSLIPRQFPTFVPSQIYHMLKLMRTHNIYVSNAKINYNATSSKYNITIELNMTLRAFKNHQLHVMYNTKVKPIVINIFKEDCTHIIDTDISVIKQVEELIHMRYIKVPLQVSYVAPELHPTTNLILNISSKYYMVIIGGGLREYFNYIGNIPVLNETRIKDTILDYHNMPVIQLAPNLDKK